MGLFLVGAFLVLLALTILLIVILAQRAELARRRLQIDANVAKIERQAETVRNLLDASSALRYQLHEPHRPPVGKQPVVPPSTELGSLCPRCGAQTRITNATGEIFCHMCWWPAAEDLALQQTLQQAKLALVHTVPDGCYSTGPHTGTAMDNECIACAATKRIDSLLKKNPVVLSSTPGL